MQIQVAAPLLPRHPLPSVTSPPRGVQSSSQPVPGRGHSRSVCPVLCLHVAVRSAPLHTDGSGHRWIGRTNSVLDFGASSVMSEGFRNFTKIVNLLYFSQIS